MKASRIFIILALIIVLLLLINSFANLNIDKIINKTQKDDDEKNLIDDDKKKSETDGEGGGFQPEDVAQNNEEVPEELNETNAKCILVRPGNAPIIGCNIISAKQSEIIISFNNQVGDDIEIKSIEIKGCSSTPSGSLKNNEEQSYAVSGCSNQKGYFEEDLILTYQLQGQEGEVQVGGKVVAVIL